MEKIEISKERLLNHYNKASGDGKQFLADLFGKDVFSQKITDRVKTFPEACAILGIDSGIYSISSLATKDEVSINAYRKLIVVARALNEGWTPDWSNSNESKYYPWMKYAVGSGFSFHGCGYDYSDAHVGSRLCFKSSELAEYAATQFQDIYNDFMSL